MEVLMSVFGKSLRQKSVIFLYVCWTPASWLRSFLQ